SAVLKPFAMRSAMPSSAARYSSRAGMNAVIRSMPKFPSSQLELYIKPLGGNHCGQAGGRGRRTSPSAGNLSQQAGPDPLTQVERRLGAQLKRPEPRDHRLGRIEGGVTAQIVLKVLLGPRDRVVVAREVRGFRGVLGVHHEIEEQLRI